MRCKNLVTAPKIPSSVKDMSYTFENCDSLTGKLIVEATLPDDYDYCERFSRARLEHDDRFFPGDDLSVFASVWCREDASSYKCIAD